MLKKHWRLTFFCLYQAAMILGIEILTMFFNFENGSGTFDLELKKKKNL